MPMGWVAAAGAIAGLAGGAMQSDAAKGAGATQANAANNATNAQLSMYNTTNQQGAPYRAAGQTALSEIMRGSGSPTNTPSLVQGGLGGNSIWNLGGTDYTVPDSLSAWAPGDRGVTIRGQDQNGAPPVNAGPAGPDASGISGGQFTHQFNASDLNSTLAPNYQFMLDQGLGATSNFLNKTGGLVSGNTLRGINDYAQGTAQNAYQQAYDMYNTNQTNIFNRLSSIAGLGQTANATSANAGTAAASGAANSMMNAGAASAAGQIGSANAVAGGLNNAASWYTLGNMMNQGGGGGSGLNTYSMNNP